MKYEQWINKINKLNLNITTKTSIVDFLSEYATDDTLDFIQINNIQLENAFYNINNYKPLTICLDIEFQSIFSETENLYNEYILIDDIVRFIRELGALFFIRDVNMKLYYIGYIFIGFKSLEEFKCDSNYIKLIGSKFSTVSNKTKNNMVKIESTFTVENIMTPLYNENIFDQHKKWVKLVDNVVGQLNDNYLIKKFIADEMRNNIIRTVISFKNMAKYKDVAIKLKYIERQLSKVQHQVYRKSLIKNDQDVFDRIHNLYWSDKEVRERVNVMSDNYSKFMNLFRGLESQAILVLKGKMDIVALKNSCRLVTGSDFLSLSNYYDIETFNGFSSLHFKSSQLENTFIGLSKLKEYNTVKPFFDKIFKSVGNKAHNPVVDSLFTIIVAVMINIVLNNGMGKIGGQYDKLYYEYKAQYLQLKKN